MALSRRFSRLPNRLKVTYSLIVLIVLTGIGVFIWAAVTGKIKLFAAGAASLNLSYSGPVSVDSVFPVYIELYTDGTAVGSVNIKYLHYDTVKLELQGSQILPDSTSDWDVIANSVDSTAGTIEYSTLAKDANGFIAQTSRLAIINFKALATGDAHFIFDYTNNPGDTDVLAKDGTDILSATTDTSVTIESNQPAPGESAAPPAPGPRPSASCVKGCSPTPTPPSSPPATAEESPSPTEIITAPTTTPTEVALTTLTPTISASPTPTSRLSSPEEPLTAPQASPVTKLAGFAITPTIALSLYIGVPAIVVLIVFLLWWWRRKKKAGLAEETPGEKEEIDIDDDEMI